MINTANTPATSPNGKGLAMGGGLAPDIFFYIIHTRKKSLTPLVGFDPTTSALKGAVLYRLSYKGIVLSIPSLLNISKNVVRAPKKKVARRLPKS